MRLSSVQSCGDRMKDVLDAAMTEAQLFESVRDHLNAFGWLWVHHYDSRRSNAGFPDIVAIREGEYGGRVLFVELKREKGQLSPDQAEWYGGLLACMRSGHPEVYVWRPSDLSSGEVERVLRSL